MFICKVYNLLKPKSELTPPAALTSLTMTLKGTLLCCASWGTNTYKNIVDYSDGKNVFTSTGV